MSLKAFTLSPVELATTSRFVSSRALVPLQTVVEHLPLVTMQHFQGPLPWKNRKALRDMFSPLQTVSFPAPTGNAGKEDLRIFRISFKPDLEPLLFLDILGMLFSLADGSLMVNFSEDPNFSLFGLSSLSAFQSSQDLYVTEPHGFHVNQWMWLGSPCSAF